jgi:hypothetical protein
MPYMTITNFSAGLDLRRSALTAPAGTLRSLKNLHLTPGGEIEKRLAFVNIATVPSNSVGLVEVNQQLYTYIPGGPSNTPPPAPYHVGTLGLDCTSIEQIVSQTLFDQKVFCVAFVDGGGTPSYFFDGSIVTGANGLYSRTYKTKIYTVAGPVLYFSCVGDPTNWTNATVGGVTGTGSGTVDLSLEDPDMSEAMALEAYYDKLAIFSKTAVQTWQIDPDPLQSQFVQTLRQAGTMAPRSVLQYGSGDVLYVNPSGIRSLRARNASLAASVSDVGSPLDPVMQDLYRSNGETWMSSIIAILQPVTGRFWIVLPDRIYILSEFPGPKITAWSEYDPGFSVTQIVTANQQIFLRDDQNHVWAYGGTNQQTFDACPVEIVLPYHGGEQPATFKRFQGLDAAAEGQWDVYASLDPTTGAEDYCGKIIGPTFLQGAFALEGVSTHISLRLRSSVAGPLILSNMVIHYELAQST